MTYIKTFVYYLYYIAKHKFYVGRECWRRGLYWQGIIHDHQKFHPIEFFAYALSYHGPYKYNERPEWLVKAYDKAWKHHVKHGSHHWEFWLRGNLATEMPLKYASEMIADWVGVGYTKYGEDESLAWYTKNRHRIKLHPNTRAYVERELNFDKAEEEKKEQAV